jgi:hypothetical protein
MKYEIGILAQGLQRFKQSLRQLTESEGATAVLNQKLAEKTVEIDFLTHELTTLASPLPSLSLSAFPLPFFPRLAVNNCSILF